MMKFKKFGNIFIIRFERGEEILSTFKDFIRNKNISAGYFTGIGAVSEAELGLYDIKSKEYMTKKFNGDFEIASLIGNISKIEDEIIIHSHIVISDRKMKTLGGHLYSGMVSATVEIHLTVIEGQLRRKKDESLGLNLLDM